MKKNLLSVTAILAIGFFTTNVEAQTSDKATANAGARLIKPMTITKTGDLYFGTINVLTGAAGKVVINPQDAVRTFDGTSVDGKVGLPATTPLYSITGTKNSVYDVTLPKNGEVIVTDTGDGANGATMFVNDFLASFGDSDDKATQSKLSSEGVDSFKVGATLELKDKQDTGIYTGTFVVSVDYN